MKLKRDKSHLKMPKVDIMLNVKETDGTPKKSGGQSNKMKYTSRSPGMQARSIDRKKSRNKTLVTSSSVHSRRSPTSPLGAEKHKPSERKVQNAMSLLRKASTHAMRNTRSSRRLPERSADKAQRKKSMLALTRDARRVSPPRAATGYWAPKSTCPVCHKKFNWLCQLKSHLATHSLARKENMFRCEECGFETKDFKMFRYHVQHAHGVTEPPRIRSNMYSCPLCHEIFPWLYHLKRHLKDHVIKKARCTASYGRESRMNILSALDTNEYVRSFNSRGHFRCLQCQKNFPTRKGLLEHIKVVHSYLHLRRGKAAGSARAIQRQLAEAEALAAEKEMEDEGVGEGAGDGEGDGEGRDSDEERHEEGGEGEEADGNASEEDEQNPEDAASKVQKGDKGEKGEKAEKGKKAEKGEKKTPLKSEYEKMESKSHERFSAHKAYCSRTKTKSATAKRSARGRKSSPNVVYERERKSKKPDEKKSSKSIEQEDRLPLATLDAPKATNALSKPTSREGKKSLSKIKSQGGKISAKQSSEERKCSSRQSDTLQENLRSAKVELEDEKRARRKGRSLDRKNPSVKLAARQEKKRTEELNCAGDDAATETCSTQTESGDKSNSPLPEVKTEETKTPLPEEKDAGETQDEKAVTRKTKSQAEKRKVVAKKTVLNMADGDNKETPDKKSGSEKDVKKKASLKRPEKPLLVSDIHLMISGKDASKRKSLRSLTVCVT